MIMICCFVGTQEREIGIEWVDFVCTVKRYEQVQKSVHADAIKFGRWLFDDIVWWEGSFLLSEKWYDLTTIASDFMSLIRQDC